MTKFLNIFSFFFLILLLNVLSLIVNKTAFTTFLKLLNLWFDLTILLMWRGCFDVLEECVLYLFIYKLVKGGLNLSSSSVSSINFFIFGFSLYSFFFDYFTGTMSVCFHSGSIVRLSLKNLLWIKGFYLIYSSSWVTERVYFFISPGFFFLSLYLTLVLLPLSINSFSNSFVYFFIISSSSSSVLYLDPYNLICYFLIRG